jgi:hypothetical protein
VQSDENGRLLTDAEHMISCKKDFCLPYKYSPTQNTYGAIVEKPVAIMLDPENNLTDLAPDYTNSTMTMLGALKVSSSELLLVINGPAATNSSSLETKAAALFDQNTTRVQFKSVNFSCVKMN